MKNPDTGKRISRLNPPSDWLTQDVPSLRILTDDLWNQELAEALERPESRSEATEIPRSLIDEVTLMPRDGALQIDLKGNLAAMLSAAQNAKWRSSETDDLHLQVKMVAGGI